jgi:hypothetical protein
MTCRERLVIIRFRFGGDFKEVLRLCRKMSRAVVIKYSFRGGHQIHRVAAYLCDK